MYKDRIKTWHFNKNLKQNEIAAILRKKAQRDRMGKQSSFQVRGRVVSIEKIDRSFRRRKGITLDMLLTKQAQVANPPDITCWTPPLSPRSGYEVPRSPSTPHSLAKPEQLFYNIDRYMSVSFNNKIWVEDGDGYLINAFTGQEDGGFLDYFFNYCSTSADFAENQLFVETRRILSKACTLVPSILKAEHPQTVENLLENFLNLISQGLREYVTQLMDYISEMARVLLPAEHPLGQICRLMGGIEPSYLEQTLIRSYECLIKTYVQCVGESDERSLWAQTQLIDYSTSDQGLFIAEQRLRRFYSQCTEATTIFSFSSINVLHSLAYNLRRQGKYIQAEMTSLELLNNAREAGYLVFQVTGLEEVAKAQFRQGKIDLAEKNVQEALELIENHWEESDPWALRRVVRLESLLQDYGLEQEAAELEMEWERRMKLCEITDEE
jgi:tetratricopeptide (TPR) repeat protein